MSFTSIKVRMEDRRWLKAEAARREVPMYRLMADIVAEAKDVASDGPFDRIRSVLEEVERDLLSTSQCPVCGPRPDGRRWRSHADGCIVPRLLRALHDPPAAEDAAC